MNNERLKLIWNVINYEIEMKQKKKKRKGNGEM